MLLTNATTTNTTRDREKGGREKEKGGRERKRTKEWEMEEEKEGGGRVVVSASVVVVTEVMISDE